MKYGYLSVIVMASAAACAAPTSSSSEGNDTVQSASSSCPMLSLTQSNQKSAATVALKLMELAAPQTVSFNGQTQYDQTVPWSILASQRYRVQSSGTGIEFDPTDNLYYYVTTAMQAALEIPQALDANLAKFLSDGLKSAYAATDGTVYPAFRSIGALIGFAPPASQTVYVPDSTCNNYVPPGWTTAHRVVISAASQSCGSQVITFAETVQRSWQYAPLLGDSIHDNWRSTPPAAFKGKAALPTTPFNGPGTGGNPYLVVSINGKALDWSNAASFAAVNCANYPNQTCTGSLQIDPALYSEPGDQYDVNGMLLGTQANPFVIDQNYIVADPTHQNNWATRSPNGVQEWGTFSQAYTKRGVTTYYYAKQY